MSVLMIIEYKDGRETHTRGLSWRDWHATVRKPGLKWVPFFEIGLTIEVDDIPSIMDELVQMKNYLAEDQNFRNHLFSMSKTDREHLNKRIDDVIEGLNEVSNDPNAEMWIG